MENVAANVDRPDIGATAPKSKAFRRAILAILLALLLAAAALAFWPAPADFRGDEATAGAGLGHGGLQRPFPSIMDLIMHHSISEPSLVASSTSTRFSRMGAICRAQPATIRTSGSLTEEDNRWVKAVTASVPTG